jgi:hypothetical protein
MVIGEKAVNSITLENRELRCTVGSDGSVSSLFSKSTGRNFVSDGNSARIFRLVLPLPDWDGHHIDNTAQQGTMRSWQDGEESGCELSYPFLSSPGGKFAVALTIRAVLKRSTVNFSISCRNGSPFRLTEIWFPWLGGLRQLTENPEETFLLVPGFFHGELLQNPYARLDPINSWLTSSPGGGRKIWLYPRIMQWVDYFGEEQGVYFGHHDYSPIVKAFLLERGPHSAPSFSMAWIRYPHLRTGECFSSSVYQLTVHEGDWHQGADIYRKWCKGWLAPREAPEDVKESMGWHFLFLKHGDGSTVRSYNDLPALFQEAKRAGLHTLQLFGWHEGGMDRDYPNYDAIESFGGEAALRKALAEITGQGGRVALYQAGSAVNLYCGEFSDSVRKWAVRTGQGDLIRRDWTWNLYDTNHWIREEPFILMCYSSGWKDLVAGNARVFLRRFGATAVHLDHIGDFEFCLCYANNHGHSVPDEAPRGITEIFRATREAMATVNPGSTLHCEGLSEQSIPWVDIHWGHNSLQRHPEVIRYTFPEALFTTTVQENQFDEAARAFVFGILLDVVIELGSGSIGEYPEFGGYILKLSQLRKKLKNYLVYGAFVDEKGLAVPQGILAKTYIASDGIGIPILNITDHSVAFPLSIKWGALGLSEGMHIIVYSLDGTSVAVCEGTQALPLQPRELKVLIATNSAAGS